MSDPSDDLDTHNPSGQPMKRLHDVCPMGSSQYDAESGSGHALTTFDDAMIASLEARDYRVLRRVQPLPPASTGGPGTGIAIGLDLETTGLDHCADEIVELAMVRVRYDLRTGELLGSEGTFSALREPGVPLPEAVSRLTKIYPEDLAGCAIDPADVESFAQGARLIIAHNATFDRRFAEAAWPIFTKLPWACSCTGVDWKALDCEGTRLSHLLMQSGYFHDGHRATDDIFAMLHCLQLKMPPFGTPAFLSLLENARAPTARIWADNAPFAKKDELKSRGYRWSAGERGAPRAWYRDIARTAVDEEVSFLHETILADTRAAPRVVAITAFDRYSDRAGMPKSQGDAR